MMVAIAFSEEEIEATIPERFERIVRMCPDVLAIQASQTVGSPINLSYAQLNRAAERVALSILARRDEEASPIALLFGHGISQVIGMLAVLKAGLFFVTLAPGDPFNHLEEILKDAGSSLILTDSTTYSLAGSLDVRRRNLFNIDQLDSEGNPFNSTGRYNPDAFASILYTSGSTGKPKGVIRSHRNLLHRAWYENKRFHIGPGDRRSLMAHSGFGSSINDIFITLLNAATLVPYDLKTLGITSLDTWLREEGITILHPPISMMREFLAGLGPGEGFPAVRLVILGGDSMRSKDVEAIRLHFSNSSVVHQYSSSETGIITSYQVDPQDELGSGILPVGFPVPGKEILILDQEGGVGEIAVRSRFLSPGYWKAPALNAAKFQPDPLEKGQMIYHTGDSGCLRPDGCLEHQGRLDSIVKIRGFRVGLGVLETALAEMPGVIQSVVVALDDPKGNRRLAAYVVPDRKILDQSTSQISARLRESLAQRLPAYMIPDHFILLDKLPLTSNLKVDRNKLPAPDWNPPQVNSAFEPPAIGLEEKLAGLWARVLGVKQVGMQDNFFELGGNSIQAARLFSEIRVAFNLRLPVITLISAPTVADLGKILANRASHQNDSPLLVPFQKEGSQPPFFCVHSRGGGLLECRRLSDLLGRDQPFYGILPKGLNGQELLDQTIPEMAAHYLEAVRLVQAHGPYLLGGICFGGRVAFEMARQLEQQGEKTALVAIFEANAPPRWRVRSPLRLDQRVRHFLVSLSIWTYDFVTGRTVDWTLRRAFRRVLRSIGQILGRKIPVRPSELMVDPDSLSLEEVELTLVEHQSSAIYNPQPYPGKITLFRVRGFSPSRAFDPHMGWDGLATGGLEVKIIEGTHSHILQEPYVASLAAALRESIRACQTGTDATIIQKVQLFPDSWLVY